MLFSWTFLCGRYNPPTRSPRDLQHFAAGPKRRRAAVGTAFPGLHAPRGPGAWRRVQRLQGPPSGVRGPGSRAGPCRKTRAALKPDRRRTLGATPGPGPGREWGRSPWGPPRARLRRPTGRERPQPQMPGHGSRSAPTTAPLRPRNTDTLRQGPGAASRGMLLGTTAPAGGNATFKPASAAPGGGSKTRTPDGAPRGCAGTGGVWPGDHPGARPHPPSRPAPAAPPAPWPRPQAPTHASSSALRRRPASARARAHRLRGPGAAL